MNKKPVVLVVMDGVGETPETLGNMVMSATTPTLDELKATCPWQVIKAHGGAMLAENSKQGGAVIQFTLDTEEISHDSE